MKVMVVGSGGREHALVWKMAQSANVDVLYTTPGNAGTSQISTNLPIPANDVEQICSTAARLDIDLVVVGPEEPLALGLVDLLRKAGIPAFGPTSSAARIESSKSWAKQIMLRAGVPTAHAVQVTSVETGLQNLRSFDYPVVLKADGLAGGKGVVIAANRAEAEQSLISFLTGRAFGDSGSTVLIESFVVGREVSLVAITDGSTVHLLPAACDYKRALDNDLGPNTGGMGAYAPALFLDEEMLLRIEQTILRPTIATMAAVGSPMTGALYAGLMLTIDGPLVLEFNARFGDPETQVILPLIEGDLATYLLRAATIGLEGTEPLRASSRSAVGVVLASGGYPGHFETGKDVVVPASLSQDQLLFHAGTAITDNANVTTTGGRVMTAVGLGASLAAAQEQAYRVAKAVAFGGKQFRSDIARRKIA